MKHILSVVIVLLVGTITNKSGETLTSSSSIHITVTVSIILLFSVLSLCLGKVKFRGHERGDVILLRDEQ